MDYAKFKAQFAGYQIVGATLFHMWDQGMSVEEARAKLEARGVAPGAKWRGRGISNVNLKYALVRHLLQFFGRMSARRLTEAQQAFIADLKDRALNMKTPLDN